MAKLSASPPQPPPSSPAPSQPPEDTLPWLEELPPKKIVAELDRYIVGQDAAKKAVAIAVRNRWRRAQAPEEIRDEIMPNNIIMIGPTGVGKTEIARRLARLAGAPFLKVEASKFTEVGYVGRDVESMVRELVDVSINMVRSEREDDVYPAAEQRAEERLLDLVLPPLPSPPSSTTPHSPLPGAEQGAAAGQRPLFVVSSKGDVQPKVPEADAEQNARRRPPSARSSSSPPRATSSRKCPRPTPSRTSAAAARARSCASSSRKARSRSATSRSRCSSKASRCSR